MMTENVGLKKNKFVSRQCSLATISLLLLVTVAQGQQQVVAGNEGLPEIIVTAQKRSQNLQDVPITISAISGADLANSGVDSEVALTAVTPGLSFTETAIAASAYLRGVGTQYANPGLEPSVATYIDDVYSARPATGMFTFSDIDHIEVIKGPQGTLYGRNTTAGAIRIITKDPTDQLSFGAGVEGGSYGMVGGNAYISGPLADHLQGRIALQSDNDNGYINTYPESGHTSDRHINAVRAKLKWEPTEALTAKLSIDFTDKTDSTGQTFLPIYPNGLPETLGVAAGGKISSDPFVYSGSIFPPFIVKNGGSELKIDYAGDGYTLSSISGLRFQHFYDGLVDVDTTTAPLFFALTKNETTRDYSEELQAVSDSAGPLTWVAGLFWFHEAGKYEFGIGGDGISAGTGVPNSFIGSINTEAVDSLAPYTQVSYKFAPKWEATVGGRYTWERRRSPFNYFYLTTYAPDFRPSGNDLVFVNDGSAPNLNWNTFSPKIELAYRPMTDVMFYAMASRGYKSGGYNIPTASAAIPDAIGQEKLTDFEFGWKTQFGVIQFNGAYFHYNLRDLQVESEDQSTGVLRVSNAASATDDGVDADVAAAVSKNLTLYAGVEYLDARFNSYPNGQIYKPCAAEAVPSTACMSQGGLGLDSFVGDLSGQSLPLAPKWTGSLRAAYSHALPNDRGTLGMTPVVSFESRYNQTVDGLYQEPGKVLLNASADWVSRDGHYKAKLFGTNLSDKRYYSFYGEFTTGGWRLPAPPREWGIRLSYDY